MAFLLTFSGGASATYKDAVRVARDSQLTLSGATPLVIDGITLVDKDRVLLRGQTAPAQNGIYVCAIAGGAYTLTRALDANNDKEVLPNMLVPVAQGTANADKIFQLVSPNVAPIVLGTDALVFTDVLIGLANKADRDLANLLPTAINQSLLFGDDTSYNIGAAAASRPQTLYVKTAINLASLTASKVVGSDGSKNLVSSSVLTTDMETSVSDTQAATNAATANTIVKRDLNSQITLKALNLDGATSGTLNIYPAATTTNYSVTLPAAQGAASTFLQNNGSGTLSWTAVPDPLPSQTGNQQKVLATDGTTASWRYAGLGDGSFGTDNIILGRAKPTGFAGYTVDNIIINSSSTAPLSVFSGAYNILIGSAGKGQTYQNDNIIIGQLPNTVGNAAASVSIGNALYIANSNYAVTIGRAATAYQEAVTVGCNSYSGNTGNVAIGSSAIAFGADSISIGRFAAMGSGASNIVIGKSSGKYPSTGADNTIVGTASFIAVTSGSSNTIIGAASATALTTGSSNVLLGKGAGSALTTGNYNTFVGNDAGSQQTTASNSVVVGQSNTIGTTAGLYYVLGNNNTCSGVGSISIGYDAHAGTGRYNLTAGISSGTTSNTGELNIFIGTNCAYGSVSNANSNVCIGYDAARWLSTGNENLLLGHGAGHTISSGTYNVALGYYAGSNIGSRTETISLGRNAGGANTGSYSVFIGSYSGQNASAGNEFYLGNQNYANNTDEKAKSLMYGQFNATPASQTLSLNAQVNLAYGERHAVATKTTTPISVAAYDYTIAVDTATIAGASAVNLPAVSAADKGRVYNIKDLTGSAATYNIVVNVAAGSGNLIDGASSQTINTAYGSMMLQSDGGNRWMIL